MALDLELNLVLVLVLFVSCCFNLLGVFSAQQLVSAAPCWTG